MFICSPILAITQYGIEEYYDGSTVFVCFNKVEKLPPCLFFLLSILLFFLLPLAILIFLYALIARTLIDHPNLTASQKTVAVPSQSVIKYRKQVVIMLGTVVVAFFVCLLPFRALTLWIIVVPAESIMKIGLENYYNLLYFSRIMFYINSAINPILYNIMSSKFRGGFFKLCGLKNMLKKRKGKTNIGRKNTNSSTTHTSQHTSESLLNRYSSRTNSKNSQSRRDSSKDIVELSCANKNVQTKAVRESYVRIPLNIVNGIAQQKVPTEEIYV